MVPFQVDPRNTMRHAFVKSLRLRFVVAAVLLLPVSLHAQAGVEVLSNESITQMIAGKLSRDLITTKISSSRPGFDLSTNGIVALTTSKVDPALIRAMFDAGVAAKKRGDAPASLTGIDETMTNDAIVKLVTAKVQKQIILNKIYAGRPSFDVTTSGLVKLSEAKVPQDIIKVMMDPTPPPPKKAGGAKGSAS
jgi:hypothetical protein